MNGLDGGTSPLSASAMEKVWQQQDKGNWNTTDFR